MRKVDVKTPSRGGRFSLRMRPERAVAVAVVAGFRLDMPINTTAATGVRRSARLGPDEWVLWAPEDEAFGGEVESALSGAFHALVDIGHRDVAFEIGGPAARDVLNSGCPLDLGDGAFGPGAATRTLLAKAEIVLLRPGADALYRLECRRSFAPYVESFLGEAARELVSDAPAG